MKQKDLVGISHLPGYQPDGILEMGVLGNCERIGNLLKAKIYKNSHLACAKYKWGGNLLIRDDKPKNAYHPYALVDILNELAHNNMVQVLLEPLGHSEMPNGTIWVAEPLILTRSWKPFIDHLNSTGDWVTREDMNRQGFKSGASGRIALMTNRGLLTRRPSKNMAERYRQSPLWVDFYANHWLPFLSGSSTNLYVPA